MDAMKTKSVEKKDKGVNVNEQKLADQKTEIDASAINCKEVLPVCLNGLFLNLELIYHVCRCNRSNKMSIKMFKCRVDKICNRTLLRKR